MNTRVSWWMRLGDIFAFTGAQMSGYLLATHPKMVGLAIGGYMACRFASLMLRPWRED
jgi:hypothetical protein